MKQERKLKGKLLAILMSLAMVFTMIPQMTAFAYADDVKVSPHDPYKHAKASRITQEYGPNTIYLHCEWGDDIPVIGKHVCQFHDWPLIFMNRPDEAYNGKPREANFYTWEMKDYPYGKITEGFPYDYAEWDGKFTYTGVNGTVEYGPTTEAPIGEGTYYVYSTVKVPSAKTIFSDGTFILGKTFTIYPSAYDVYFDPNVPDSASTKLQGAMDKEHFKSAVEKQALYPNQFRLPGYTFAGWNSIYNEHFEDNAIVSELSYGTDVILYAQWTPKPYNVTLKPGFEGGAENNLTASFDQPVTLPTAEELGLEYPNHTFLGWKASDSEFIYPGGTSIVNLCGALDNYFNDPNDVELEAQWVGNGQIIAVVNKDDEPMKDLGYNSFQLIADTGTIFKVPAFYDDGRYIFDPSNAEQHGAAPAALPPGKYTLFLAGVLDEGYIPTSVGIEYGGDKAVSAAFNYYTVSLEADPAYKDLHQVRMVGVEPDADGRYTTVALAGNMLSLETSVNEGYHFDGYSAEGVAPSWDGGDRMKAVQGIKVQGKAQIMAHVAANNYTVKFDANTKTPVIGEMKDQDMVYDEPQNLFANQFARSGAVFTGWNTKADGSGEAYSDEQSVKNLTAENGGSVTLYAQWKETPAETALLTFDLNGGTLDGKTGSIAVRENKGNVIKMPVAPERDGYTFKYWKGSEYLPGDEYEVEGDHTFTATWEEPTPPEPTPPEPTPPEPTPPEPTPPEPTPDQISGKLLAKAVAKGRTGMAISWNKIQGAEGYDIFFARCNHNDKKVSCRNVGTIEGNTTFKWTKAGLKKNTAYKAYVKAYVMKDGKKQYVRTSPLVHAFTGNGTKNYTNARSVTVNKSKVTLQQGKTFKVKAKVKKVKKNKKLMGKAHAPKFRYMTTDSKVAAVSKSGKITARGKGTCSVRVFAHNGASKTIKVTVR